MGKLKILKLLIRKIFIEMFCKWFINIVIKGENMWIVMMWVFLWMVCF